MLELLEKKKIQKPAKAPGSALTTTFSNPSLLSRKSGISLSDLTSSALIFKFHQSKVELRCTSDLIDLSMIIFFIAGLKSVHFFQCLNLLFIPFQQSFLYHFSQTYFDSSSHVKGFCNHFGLVAVNAIDK